MRASGGGSIFLVHSGGGEPFFRRRTSFFKRRPHNKIINATSLILILIIFQGVSLDISHFVVLASRSRHESPDLGKIFTDLEEFGVFLGAHTNYYFFLKKFKIRIYISIKINFLENNTLKFKVLSIW